MKLTKKILSLLTVLAMTVVMLPLGGALEAKAGSTEHTYVGTSATDSTGFLTIAKGTSAASTGSSKNLVDGTAMTKGLKMENATTVDFTIPADKYAQVTMWAVPKVTELGEGQLTYGKLVDGAMDTESSTAYTFSGYQNASVEAAKIVFNIPVASADTTYRMVKTGSNQVIIYQINVVIYDTEAELPELPQANPTYQVSGTITSLVDLSGGQITLQGTGGASGDITKTGDNQYFYTVEVEENTAGYDIKLTSPALKSEKYMISQITPAKVVVGTAAVTQDISVEYTPLTNVWDFAGGMDVLDTIGEGKTGIYKGLSIDATASGKFDVQANRVQVNPGTKVSIPVSGHGTVKVAFDSGSWTLDGQTDATSVEFTSAQSAVELVATASNTYLTKIEVISELDDTTNSTPVNVQYKKDDNGSYTVRAVYEVTEADLENYSEIGAKLTVNTKTENILGSDVFTSLTANGKTVTPASGNCFVIVQITDVPANAVIEVNAVAVQSGSEVSLGSNGTIDMAAILGTN